MRTRKTERGDRRRIWLAIQAANERMAQDIAHEHGKMPRRWVEDADDTRAIDEARRQLRRDGFVNVWDYPSRETTALDSDSKHPEWLCD